MNDWSWKRMSTVKRACFIISKNSRIYFGVPNIVGRLKEPLRGHTTRKNEDFWQSVHGFCLGIGLLSACLSPFQLWSLCIIFFFNCGPALCGLAKKRWALWNLENAQSTHLNNVTNRDRPRFFDQVGHQTPNASIGNKHFFH